MHTARMSESSPQDLTDVVRSVVAYFSDHCEVSVADNGPDTPLLVAVQVPDEAHTLIGKDGQNLKALEHVVRTIWKRRDPAGRQITIDINDYRKTRATEIVSLVHETAQRIRDTRRPEALDPMTAYERRIVHTELAAYTDLATESIGQEPHRRVVIKPL